LDIYIAYLLAASGRSCWYTAERLAQVRYHPTRIGATSGSNPEVMEWDLSFWRACLASRLP
jgi:hypothetical protein